VSFYSSYSTPPAIAPGWHSGVLPLNQTREQTRDQIRSILGMPVILDSLVEITVAMNTIADLSPEAITRIEALLAEHKTLITSQVAAQSRAAWDGAAPLKRADVLEYDTSLLARGDWAAAQTQGLVARQRVIELDIKKALGMNTINSSTLTANLYRS
jgi:hypothetical protein